MRVTTLGQTLGLVLAGLLSGTVVAAQNPTHTHIGHVADGFRDTPDGQGLLPTALAEAEVAAQHAGFAARDPNNLDGARRHMSHVLHAIDPSVVGSGPGLGYGLERAAEAVVRHIELAASADGVSDNVSTHANHIVTAAGNAVMNIDRVVALAERIQAATNASEAAPLVEELAATAEAILEGTDANGDGRVGWQTGEGGLRQADQHLTLMRRGEGLID